MKVHISLERREVSGPGGKKFKKEDDCFRAEREREEIEKLIRPRVQVSLSYRPLWLGAKKGTAFRSVNVLLSGYYRRSGLAGCDPKLGREKS